MATAKRKSLQPSRPQGANAPRLLSITTSRLINTSILPLVPEEMAVPIPAVESAERWHGVVPVEPSPPDLQVLHSTFLI